MREDVEYKEGSAQYADDRAYLKSEINRIEQGQVTEELSRLEELCDVIHKDVSILNDKIFPILKEDYPSPTAPGGEDTPMMVPLAQKLRDINEQLIRAHLRMSNIEERISL